MFLCPSALGKGRDNPSPFFIFAYIHSPPSIDKICTTASTVHVRGDLNGFNGFSSRVWLAQRNATQRNATTRDPRLVL